MTVLTDASEIKMTGLKGKFHAKVFFPVPGSTSLKRSFEKLDNEIQD